MEQSIKKKDECAELKNIQYKTMLLTGKPINESKSNNSLMNLDEFLEQEKMNNTNEPWCKLNKTTKISKLTEFIDVYKVKNELDVEEEQLLNTFFKECLEKKKLQRVKDVTYDKVNGIIKDIPALTYVKAKRHFTLKNMDKRASTLDSLSSKKN